MGKIHRRSIRRDSMENHIHALPDGKYTQGSLEKPSKDQFGWHSHLYELDGVILETGPAKNDASHVHESDYGMTSGPLPVRKDSASVEVSIQRRGSEWHVVAENGRSIGRHSRKGDAERQLIEEKAG